MRVAIIGGGWVGSHLAGTLLAQGGTEIVLFEAANRLFSAQSSTNQNRLHLGFHYPRSFTTIEEQVKGFAQFQKIYPTFSHSVERNIYAIAKTGSLLDFRTFCLILSGHGINFTEIDATSAGLANVEGAVCCHERAIDNSVAAAYFTCLLGASVRFNHRVRQCVTAGSAAVVDGQLFDFVVNATGNHFNPIIPDNFKYEVCILGKYRSKTFGNRGMTIMDGPFGSVYPCPENGRQGYFLASGVRETVVSSHFDASTATIELDQLRARADLPAFAKTIAEKIQDYYPKFSSTFTLVDVLTAVKTKPREDDDAGRRHFVYADGPIITVVASKITHIFAIESAVFAALGFKPQTKQGVA